MLLHGMVREGAEARGLEGGVEERREREKERKRTAFEPDESCLGFPSPFRFTPTLIGISTSSPSSPSSSLSPSPTSSALIPPAFAEKSRGPRVSVSPSCCRGGYETRRGDARGGGGTYAEMALYEGVDVGRTILVEFDVTVGSFLYINRMRGDEDECDGEDGTDQRR